ncbi:cysteine-rich venom protein 6-like [Oppia nitens]|uniref:cysteine-rich venom protein 6-like n=1 Tax=Oppia nitens TaxID=1686743 RepID=UPI0023D9C54B|nr:cysteine-rich venom protein 6-like [Oppia nitens]XP_054166707.1 cysteine-rich venom protein 6-like [Oppia nitens]
MIMKTLLVIITVVVVIANISAQRCRTGRYSACQAHCQPSCENPNPVCTRQCIPGCICARDLIRRNSRSRECVSPSQCFRRG